MRSPIPAVAEALQERTGAFDVGEEEGDRPGWQARHLQAPQKAQSKATGFARRSASQDVSPWVARPR